MFNKLKDRFKKWLFREELCRLEYLEKTFNKSANDLSIAKTNYMIATDEIISATKTCEQLRDVCTPLLDVGMDVGFREEHSWAVVCVKGKPEYVKFIPLTGADSRDLRSFLKRYERSNNVVDSPLAFQNILKPKIFI